MLLTGAGGCLATILQAASLPTIGVMAVEVLVITAAVSYTHLNYVDLLQHEHTPEQEEEYLAVLKRQAFKLKSSPRIWSRQARPRLATCR